MLLLRRTTTTATRITTSTTTSFLRFRCLLPSHPHTRTPAPTHHHQHQPTRPFSTIWRKVQEGLQNRTAAKEEEQFQIELQRLATLDKYDLNTFKDAMDGAEKGSWFSWVNKVPGVRSLPEVQMGEKYKKILNALTSEERAHPELIQSRAKQRVSTETGESVQEINLLLNLYTNSQALHSWVRRRVRDKKELPKTKSECQVLMMGDPTGISVGNMQKKMQKRSGRRGSRLPF